MENQTINNEVNFKVCIRCLTYNHHKYIRDTLNGFVKQQTNFPFIALVVDDASTDGAQEVIKAYIDEQFNIDDTDVAYTRETDYAYITFAQHKFNLNCYVVVLYLKFNHYQIKKKKVPYLYEWRKQVKYEALCEGDDFWIDPLKLQKQVEYLDQRPDVGLIHTAYHIVGEDSKILSKDEIPDLYRRLTSDCSVGYIYDRLFNHPSSILTCTILYRIEMNDVKIDHDLFMQVAKKYKIAYINDITSCYRILPTSMMRSRKEEVNLMLFDTISMHMLKYYQGDEEINSFYNQSELKKEVDLFFSKYITYYIRNRKFSEIPFKTIFKLLLKRPRLLFVTPCNIIKRLCLSI